MGAHDTLEDAIIKNYNEVGAVIIQKLFGDGYLSPCGADAADQLLVLAKPSRDDRMLDVGSGLGGAAVRVAEQCGCTITGLDLVASNVRAASDRDALMAECARVFSIVIERNGVAMKAFESGQLGGGNFLARLPA